MSKWKLQIRNKIEDSNIEEPVKGLCNSSDGVICSLARQVGHTALAPHYLAHAAEVAGLLVNTRAVLQNPTGIENRFGRSSPHLSLDLADSRSSTLKTKLLPRPSPRPTFDLPSTDDPKHGRTTPKSNLTSLPSAHDRLQFSPDHDHLLHLHRNHRYPRLLPPQQIGSSLMRSSRLLNKRSLLLQTFRLLRNPLLPPLLPNQAVRGVEL